MCAIGVIRDPGAARPAGHLHLATFLSHLRCLNSKTLGGWFLCGVRRLVAAVECRDLSRLTWNGRICGDKSPLSTALTSQRTPHCVALDRSVFVPAATAPGSVSVARCATGFVFDSGRIAAYSPAHARAGL